MNMTSFLHFIITIYEKFYILLATGLHSYGLAIIVLSILTSILMLGPIRWANRIASKEQAFQTVLRPQIERIKIQSSGAQQYARINALYRRYAYHPIFAVRKVLGLFMQLPFLVLTYFMFEGLAALNGKPFLFLPDLGTPDGILGVGNLLPFIMTAINLSAALLTPHFSRKDLTRATVINLIFFMLLYHSMSALLLYWTMNNAITLFRNMIAYNKADKIQRINVKMLWRNFLLFILRKEVALFLIIFLIYALCFELFFVTSYSLILTRAIDNILIWIIIFLAFVHFLFYTKDIWLKPRRIISGVWLKVDRINNKKSLLNSRVSFADFFLVLIPLAPIIQYALLNQDYLTFENQLFFAGISVAIIFGIVIVIPFILQRCLPTFGLVPLGVALSYVYVSMPEFTILFRWPQKPDVALLAAIFLILFSALCLLHMKHRKLLYYLAAIFFMVSIMYTTYVIYILQNTETASSYLNKKEVPIADFSNFIPTGPMKKKPDIYLLTHDAYVVEEVMEQNGIDNSAQEAFLMDNGFKIYRDTYSVGYSTLRSMSRVLEMASDPQLTKPESFSMAGNALVVDILKEQGYRTYGVFPFFLSSAPAGYDDTFPPLQDTNSLGLRVLWEGLRAGGFNIELRRMPPGYTPAEYYDAKRNVMRAQTPYPKFMYAHTGPAHSQLSGACLPNETALYEQRLIEANQGMKEDIKTILESKRDAIIIVNGDHGPYLTGDCYVLSRYSTEDVSQLDLQNRFASFLAIRWPDEDHEQYDDIVVLQDVFEVVFKDLFATDQVLRKSPSTETMRINNTFPAGIVVSGEITAGKDKGKPLFNQ